MYGWKQLSANERPIIERIHAHLARITAAAVPGAYMVEIVPALDYLPEWMTKWKREGREWYRRDTEMFEGLVRDAMEKRKVCLYMLMTRKPVNLTLWTE